MRQQHHHRQPGQRHQRAADLRALIDAGIGGHRADHQERQERRHQHQRLVEGFGLVQLQRHRLALQRQFGNHRQQHDHDHAGVIANLRPQEFQAGEQLCEHPFDRRAVEREGERQEIVLHQPDQIGQQQRRADQHRQIRAARGQRPAPLRHQQQMQAEHREQQRTRIFRVHQQRGGDAEQRPIADPIVEHRLAIDVDGGGEDRQLPDVVTVHRHRRAEIIDQDGERDRQHRAGLADGFDADQPDEIERHQDRGDRQHEMRADPVEGELVGDLRQPRLKRRVLPVAPLHLLAEQEHLVAVERHGREADGRGEPQRAIDRHHPQQQPGRRTAQRIQEGVAGFHKQRGEAEFAASRRRASWRARGERSRPVLAAA